MKFEAVEDIPETTNPLVSIIVPSYNHEKYIKQCIESIINQTYKNYELIVIDDGSTDRSIKILRGLSLKYHFELVLQSNQGLSKTLTNAIQFKAKGEYISLCASDDYWAINKIEEQVKFLETNRDYAMCFSKCYYVDEKSNILDTKYHYANDNKYKSGDIFEDLFLMKYHLPVSYMYKKKILEEINYFSNDIYCEDYNINLRISKYYPIGFIDLYLMFYRFQRNTNEKTIKIINSQKQIIDLYKENPLHAQAIKNWKIRAFSTYSYYPTLKSKCISYIFDYSIMTNLQYWKNLLKFFIKW